MLINAKYFYKIFSLKQGELQLLLYSILFVFLLFSSYAILRPIRDSLGLSGGSEELKWLFLATFITSIIGSILIAFMSAKIKRKHYINTIFIFFGINLFIFYFAFSYISLQSLEFLWLSRIFYVWTSVFNLFILSSAWSLLADIFNKQSSQRLFGIICAGASLGSIFGALLVSIFVKILGNEIFLLLSFVFLIATIFIKNRILHSYLLLLSNDEKNLFEEKFNRTIGTQGIKNPFSYFGLILKSPYLLALSGFILLLTSVSTFLYMEQARVIKELFPSREARTAAFANIDLIVQISSFIIQIFFTAKIVQFLGLKALLCALGFIIGFGFIVLCFTHPAFLPLVIVMSIRRIGEYALVKPGREMLFVPLDSNAKYKVKIFLDSVVYRGGDALSAQIEGQLIKFGISTTLLVGALFSFAWGFLGLFLANKYEKLKDSK